jgi:hypothetical protein
LDAIDRVLNQPPDPREELLRVASTWFQALIGLAVTLLVFAAFGYLFYLVLRVVSPSTAARVRDVIRGHPANVP